MSLSQDQAQASQAQNILDEQQYQKDLAQYDKDTIQYNKEKAAYDLQVKNIKDAESAEKKRIEDAKIAAEKKAADRAAEIKAVNDKWDSNKSPWYKNGDQFGGYMERDNDSRKRSWQTAQYTGRKNELNSVIMSHVKADGFSPTSINRGGYIPYPTHPTSQKLYTGEAVNPVAAKALQSNTPSGSISNRWTRYQVEISRANAAVYAGGSLQAHASAVQAAKDTFDGTEKQEQLKFSAAAQKEAVNQRAGDAAHWNEVINNPNTSKDLQKTNQDTLEKQGLHIDVKALDVSGVSSIYNILDMSKSGSLPSSASVTINTKKYSISNQPDSIIIPTRTNTSGNNSINKANIAQKQYANDLRSGKVGLAQALLQPQTPQSYSPGNTINLKQFLVERGYDISKPETIPNSVLTTPVKYDAARKQASYAVKTNTPMGDLRGFIPSQPKVSDGILQERQNALSFNASKVNKGSYIGYGPDGTPVQGAPAPVKTQWAVDSGKTKDVIIPRMDGSTYTVREKSDPVLFETKEQAQAYIDYQNKTNPYTISQGYSKQGNISSQKQFFTDAYKFLDDFGKDKQKEKVANLNSKNPQLPIGRFDGTYDATAQAGIGLGKMALGAVIQIDNLATQTIAPWFSKVTGTNPQNQLPAEPLIQSNASSDQTLIPYNFEESKWQTKQEWTTAQLKYIETYGPGDYVGGIVGGYWIGSKGAGAFSPIARKLVPTVVTVPGRTALGGVVQVTKDVSKYRLQVPPVVSMAKEAIKAANPINIQRYDQVGVTLLESGGVVGVKPFTVSIGYGTRLQPLVSKVGSSIQLGNPNIARSKVSKVSIDPSVQPDPKRGVKMAAGNTAYEQKLAPQLFPLVEGIAKAEVRKAEVIYDIQKITTSKRKDTMYRKSLPRNAFANLTHEEAVQVLEISKKAQRAKNFPIGAYEGSVSQPYFVAKEFARKMGDFDFHSKDFLEGQMIIKRYEGMTPSFGRKFLFDINEINKSIQGKTQNIVKINYVDTAEEAERLNRANIKKATNVKFVDTDTYRIEQTRKYNLPSDYFGDVREGHLFGQYQKPHSVLNQSRRRVNIPETVIIEKNAQSNYTALNPLERSKYLDATGNFDNTAWQKTVIQHELIHKANPNLTERQVRTLADGYSVDELGMTKAMKKFQFVEPDTVKVYKNVIMKDVESVPLTLPKGDKVGSKTGKFIEILNAEQTDEFGAAQTISGDTIFGKATPTTTYKVKEGKTYGRQRQIVKKGESLYSLRKDPVTGDVTVGAMPGRANKDTADFYALAESARRIENYSPGDKAKLGKLLEEFKISHKTDDFDVDEYLKNNAIYQTKEDPVTLTVGTSLLQRTQQKAGVIAAYTTTPGIQSYKFIPRVKQESTSPNSVTSTSRVSTKKSVLSQSNVSLSRPSTSRSLVTSTSRPSTSRPSTSRPSTSRPSTSRPSPSMTSTSRPSPSMTSTSRPSTSRPSTSRPSPSRPRMLRSRPSTSRPSTSRSSNNSVNSVPTVSRHKAIGGWVNIVESDKGDKKSKNHKTKDFLGNTRLDNIVGLFKRREIISGDKASAKQLQRDKKFKEGDKKRKHKAKKSFGQRIGVIEKGFKI